MKHVFLHIGLEKTGTTSLQTFLKNNKKGLKKAGFSYLCEDSKPYFEGIGHFPVAGCFHSECPKFISQEKFLPPSEVLGALKQDIEQCTEHVILSCEHFSSRLHEQEILEAIRTAMAGRAITVICYLRRQDRIALAAYSTMVLYGCVNPFSFHEVINPTNKYFNYARICKLWASVFGADNIIVKEYDWDFLKGGDIRKDFLSQLNIECSDFHFEKNENASLDATQVEALRMVNKFLADIHSGDRNSYDLTQEIRWALIKYLPKGEPLHSMLSEKNRGIILRHFQNTNTELAETFNGAKFLLEWQPQQTEQDLEKLTSLSQGDNFAKTIALLGGQLVTVRRENVNLVAEYNQTKQQVATARSNLEDLTQSTSWRLTSPLRSVGTIGRRILNVIRKLS